MTERPWWTTGVPAIVLAVTTALAQPAGAQSPSARCIEELTDAEVEARYQMVYRALAAEETHGKWWYFGWLSLFTGLATAQGIMAALDVGGLRPRHMAGTIGNGLSIFAYVIFPRLGLETAMAAPRLRRIGADTPEDRRERLLRAEAMLERVAARQDQNSNPVAHLQGYAFGVAASLTLGLAYNDLGGALQFGIASPAVNHARVLTAPTGAIRSWRNYRTAVKSCMARPLRERPTLHFTGSLGHATIELRWW
jgi:hypothetical protein